LVEWVLTRCLYKFKFDREQYCEKTVKRPLLELKDSEF